MPQLVADRVASGITAQDPALWGPDAEPEASKRLGWTEAVAMSRPLVAEIVALREQLHAKGVNHIVLGGMGGSSLAPEVITRTAGVPSSPCSTRPTPVRSLSALARPPAGHRRRHLVQVGLDVWRPTASAASTRSAFRDAGIDPAERIVVVTDPGSPLDAVGTRRGLPRVQRRPQRRRPLLGAHRVRARSVRPRRCGHLRAARRGGGDAHSSSPSTTTRTRDSCSAPRSPAATHSRTKLGIVADGTHIVGFADWAEQLIAESTGKEGTGLLPVVLDTLAPELTSKPADLQVVRLVANAEAHHLFPADRHAGEVLVSGSLGAQLLVWEYATAVAGRLLGINPFDQPDVEAAKVAARALLDNRPEPAAPAFTVDGVEVRTTGDFLGAASTLDGAVEALLAQLGPDGYVAVQAYVDRLALPQLAGIRDLLAAKAGRPVTFGWGPRFLHSTGQFHKGGPAVGVFLQITAAAAGGPRDPGPSVHVRPAHPGPGRR